MVSLKKEECMAKGFTNMDVGQYIKAILLMVKCQEDAK